MVNEGPVDPGVGISRSGMCFWNNAWLLRTVRPLSRCTLLKKGLNDKIIA